MKRNAYNTTKNMLSDEIVSSPVISAVSWEMYLYYLFIWLCSISFLIRSHLVLIQKSISVKSGSIYGSQVQQTTTLSCYCSKQCIIFHTKLHRRSCIITLVSSLFARLFLSALPEMCLRRWEQYFYIDHIRNVRNGVLC